MSAAALYTPEVLSLATGLAAWPWDDALPLRAEARSRSCGSVLALGAARDAFGRLERIGLRAQACAIGQAAAAVFASAALGRDADRLVRDRTAVAGWLAEGGALPDWPGLAAIAAARDYPARHGAVMLAWNAACDLLPSKAAPR